MKQYGNGETEVVLQKASHGNACANMQGMACEISCKEQCDDDGHRVLDVHNRVVPDEYAVRECRRRANLLERTSRALLYKRGHTESFTQSEAHVRFSQYDKVLVVTLVCAIQFAAYLPRAILDS
eukprot:c38401_g1_i1 orf=80-451(-)